MVFHGFFWCFPMFSRCFPGFLYPGGPPFGSDPDSRGGSHPPGLHASRLRGLAPRRRRGVLGDAGHVQRIQQQLRMLDLFGWGLGFYWRINADKKEWFGMLLWWTDYMGTIICKFFVWIHGLAMSNPDWDNSGWFHWVAPILSDCICY